MSKSNLIAKIPLWFAIEGAFLIIYGFMTGAKFLAIVFVFIDTSFPIRLKDFYVILGIARIIMAIAEIKSKHTRSEMVVTGVFFVSFSIVGIIYPISSGDITVSNVYGIVIEFIVMLSLSLLYLIHAFRQVRS